MTKKLLLIISTLYSAYAIAQTCIVNAPSSPPVPTQATVYFPADGGTQGCTFTAFAPGGSQPTNYAVSNAKCLTMVTMARQAVANDNGWNDGGIP